MRTLLTFILQLVMLCTLVAQTPMKQIHDKPFVAPQPLQIANAPSASSNSGRLGKPWQPGMLLSINAMPEVIEQSRLEKSGSFWIEFKPNQLWASRSSIKTMLEKVLPVEIQNEPWAMNWHMISESTDAQNTTHIRVQQTLAGHPIHRQDMVLHVDNGMLSELNGFAWTGKLPEKLPAPVPQTQAFEAVKDFLIQNSIRFQESTPIAGLQKEKDKADLVWYPMNGKLVLAYEVEMHPNLMDHWTVFINASSLEVIESYSELCSIAPLQLYDMSAYKDAACKSDMSDHANPSMLIMDGPTVISDQDLKGQNRTVNAYQVGSNFFMIDASRSGMFQANQSVMPNEPVGTVWTLDGQNTSPQQSNFEVVHASNTNNNWKNLEVSAHFNGGEAYEYFRSKFNRNSINGSGGNIISIINVTDENDNSMDNAFWNGAAMFYGNGNVAFNAPLAKALDVAGHEMSHGVIQNTANLEYVGQSGALNESYADIFGAMIDRDDWQMGEEVSNPAFFPSGTMRDLSNPNNGGSGPNDPGWQPKHMNEYQNLPNTPQGDNGGVHVNSGIVNRAFFLLATAIGKDKAEQIYYKAIKDYLVKSSQFIDMRNAAEKAAGDLHGTGSTEVTAVKTAFSTVGIGAGQGGDYEEDIETNGGDDFILATDDFSSDLYWVPPDNPNQFVKMNLPAPISIPSFTDDGSACVYVDNENNMIVVNFDWSQGLNYQAFYLEDNPQGIWRNVIVSKDGTKIAYTTSNLRNEISVFDFDGGANDVYVLYNPTTATGGINTGDVLYPDVMEWDYSGEYIMYDALNRIESGFGGGIEYWDISFLHAWDEGANNLGSGQIGKLFSALPENISVGNASFAKNSPYIIVFDFLEDYYDAFGQLQTEYRIKAANIEAGQISDIYINTTVGYPSYSRLDDKILFTYDNNGTLLLATIDVQTNNKIVPVTNTDVILITGAQKGVWFSTGSRIFTSTEDAARTDTRLQLTPQPAGEYVFVSGKDLSNLSDYNIFDLAGNALLQGDIARDNRISIGSLLPGVYFLQIRDIDGRMATTKFVKQ